MIETHTTEIHRMTLYQRCLLWALDAMERLLALFPRQLRQRLRVHIDRAQSRLHSRVHDHSERL